jgi:hypothetical protein
MKPDKIIHQHKMTLYNHDLIINWKYENDHVKIIEIHFMSHEQPDLLRFLSGKVFRMIVEDIEVDDMRKKWM